jgi:hypothetical protein
MNYSDKRIVAKYNQVVGGHATKSVFTQRLLPLAKQIAESPDTVREYWREGDLSGLVAHARSGIAMARKFDQIASSIPNYKKAFGQYPPTTMMRFYKQLFALGRKYLKMDRMYTQDGKEMGLFNRHDDPDTILHNVFGGDWVEFAWLGSGGFRDAVEQVHNAQMADMSKIKENRRIFNEVNNQIKRLVARLDDMSPTEIRRQVKVIQETYLSARGRDKLDKNSRIANRLTEARRYAKNPTPEGNRQLKKSLLWVGEYLMEYGGR